MIKIKIKPKSRQNDIIQTVEREREREQQQERQEKNCCCDEIRKLRCEMETMKTEMAEIKQYLREFQKKEEIRRITYGGEEVIRGTHSSDSEFSEWINGLEMMPEDLEKLFQSKDIIDWACHFIMGDLNKKKIHPYPLCSIKDSKNDILVYDSKRWRKISDAELFTKFTDKLFKKILKTFTQWKNDNYSRILTSEHFATMYHSNYAKILSFNENFSKLKLKLFHILDNQNQV